MKTTKDIIKMIFQTGYELDIRNSDHLIFKMLLVSWEAVHDLKY